MLARLPNRHPPLTPCEAPDRGYHMQPYASNLSRKPFLWGTAVLCKEQPLLLNTAVV